MPSASFYLRSFARFTLAATTCLLLGPTLSSAATIFDNFGPGDTYGPTDSDITGPAQLAFQFDVAPAGPDYQLTQIVIPLDSETAPTTTNLFLAIDDGGAPGTVVASFPTVTVLNPLPGDIFTLAPVATATLVAGQSYWLVNSPPPGVEIGWGTYSGGAFLTGAFRLSGAGSWSPFDSNVAFRVEGTPVPEPGTAMLIGLSLAALSRSERRR